MKPSPAVILDHAGNCIGEGGVANHGFPDDEREWSLDGREKRKSSAEALVPIRQCPECFHVHRPSPACPACGHIYEIQGREIEEVDGDLVEVSRDGVALAREKSSRIKEARGVDELIRVALEYQHKANWIIAVMRGRKKRVEMEDLVKIAGAYGYKPGWAVFQHRRIYG